MDGLDRTRPDDPVPESNTLGRAGVRVSWGVADQLLSSLTNFVLGVVVARSTSVTSFGVFSLGFSVFIFGVGVSRSLTSDPLLVRHSGVDHAHWRDAVAAATGVSLMLGMIGGVVVLVAGLLVGGSTGLMFIALGCSLPGLLVQDGWRYGYVAGGRSRLAFTNDLVFLVLMIPAFALVIGADVASVGNLVFAWGGAATIAAVIAATRARLAPNIRRAASWLRQEGDLGYRYATEFAAGNGAFQLTLLLVVALADLAAVGSLRAAFILFGPVLVIFASALLVVVPEGVRVLRRGTDRLRRLIAVLAAGLALISLVWGGAVWLLPDGVGEALLGDSWSGTRELVLPFTIMLAASGMETAFIIGLRSLAAARQSLLARSIETVLTVAGGAIGAIIAGARGAAWGLAAAYCLEVAVWSWQFSTALSGARHPTDNEARDVAAVPGELLD